MSTNQAASVTIGMMHYRARCSEPECGNLARLGLRYADAGGRPTDNFDLSDAHTRV